MTPIIFTLDFTFPHFDAVAFAYSLISSDVMPDVILHFA